MPAKFTEHGHDHADGRPGGVAERRWLTFPVTDAGIGMTPEQMEKLFQTFSQADASTTRKFGGTGLGLAITKRLCHMLGGDIDVVSELGHGSTFTVRLPGGTGPGRGAAGGGRPATSVECGRGTYRPGDR